MSNRDNSKRSHPINQEEENKKLWDKLKIYFRLESTVFLENRIFGSINIKPDEAFKLIKKFVLVTNDSVRSEVDCNIRKIFATVFDSTKKDFSIYIEAIPKYNYLTPKRSMEQCFVLTPTVICEWSSENFKPCLIVQWFHRGYKLAQIYILCLDKKEIQYIHKPSEHDAYRVCINGFQPGTRHTLQLLARLNNGKETYRSELIDFIVPDKGIQGITQIINVSEEPGEPDDMQDLIDKDEEEENKERGNSSPKTTIQRRTSERTKTLLSCGCEGPHEEFLGSDHYFEINRNKPQPYIQRKPLPQNRRISSSTEEDTDDNAENQRKEQNDGESDKEYSDDDKDVIYGSTHPDRRQ